ncbi:acid protease [Amylostereum chailletii]|nr:acid protease [Amylostereum chailletii]
MRAFAFLVLPALAAAAPVTTLPTGTGGGTGTSVPLTKRSKLLNEDGGVNLKFLSRHLDRVTSKLDRGLTAYLANTGIAHTLAQSLNLLHLSDPLTRRAGNLALADEDDIVWTGTLSIGTPPKEFSIDFDTGSSDIVVPAAECTDVCKDAQRYNISTSSSGKDLGRNFTLKYGDGSQTSGKQIGETVTVAGLQATNQTIGAASAVTDGFLDSMDGLVGLAFPTISTYHAQPLMQTLLAQNKSLEPVFGMKLAKNGSQLTLGGTDKTLYTGEPTYVPVTEEGYWQVDFAGIKVGKEDLALNKTKTAIVDSGTTLIIGDEDSVRAFYAAVPGAKEIDGQPGLFSVPCEGLPEMSITFGNKAINIAPETFNLGPVQSGSSDCVAGVQYTSGVSFWIFGDVLMKNVRGLLM